MRLASYLWAVLLLTACHQRGVGAEATGGPSVARSLLAATGYRIVTPLPEATTDAYEQTDDEYQRCIDGKVVRLHSELDEGKPSPEFLAVFGEEGFASLRNQIALIGQLDEKGERFSYPPRAGAAPAISPGHNRDNLVYGLYPFQCGEEEPHLGPDEPGQGGLSDRLRRLLPLTVAPTPAELQPGTQKERAAAVWELWMQDDGSYESVLPEPFLSDVKVRWADAQRSRVEALSFWEMREFLHHTTTLQMQEYLITYRDGRAASALVRVSHHDSLSMELATYRFRYADSGQLERVELKYARHVSPVVYDCMELDEFGEVEVVAR